MKKNIGLVLLASASFAAIVSFGENVVTPRYYAGESLVASFIRGSYVAANPLFSAYTRVVMLR